MRIKRKNYRKSFSLFNWLCKYPVFLILLVGTCVSCHTFFKRKNVVSNNLSTYKAGTFSGTVLISQRKSKHYFNADLLVSEENKMRMDLNISPGISVFTLLLGTKDITFLFLRKREFYKGDKNNDALSAFFPKNLKFSIFKDIFFDRRPEGKSWICKTDKQGLPFECRNSKWTIQWTRGGKRDLFLKTADFTFNFKYSSFSPKINGDLLDIQIPENFKRISLTQ